MRLSALRTSRLFARIFVWGLAAFAITWGMLLLPIFWQEASQKAVASKLLQGDTFKQQSLFEEAHRAEKAAQYPNCNLTALHNLFILRLFIYNASNEPNNREQANLAYPPLYSAAIKSLSCAPADPFAWLTVFWLEAGKHGISDRSTRYLRLSYRSGANEGWISPWRVRLAFLIFEHLPPDIADDAINEFVALVNTGHYSQTAQILKDASPMTQTRVVNALKAASIQSRVEFAAELRAEDSNIEIPGVEKPKQRPWR